ncbi:MAG TPA: PAS domain S-box protein [Anaerolineae bacterium]|nr:PAS domain S-box protein [Anaerolineae bacterium]
MARFFPSSLRSRLILLVLLAVIPVVGLVIGADLEQRYRDTLQAQATARAWVRLLAADQEKNVDDARQVLIALTRSPEVRSGDPARCTDKLFELLTLYADDYSGFGLARPDGSLFCSTVDLTQPVNISDRLFFQRAIETRDFAVGDYRIAPQTGNPVLTFGYPLVDANGQLEGVVFATKRLAALTELVDRAELPNEAVVIIVDRDGTIMDRRPTPENLDQDRNAFAHTPLIQTLLAQEQGVAELPDIDGVTRLTAFQRVPGPGDTGITLGVGLPLQVAFAEANQRLALKLGLLGLFALLGLALARYFGNVFVLRGVNLLMRTTQQVREGNFSARSKPARRGAAELKQLASAFNAMTAALEQREAERRVIENTIREQRELLRVTLASIGDAVIATDTQGRVTFLNPIAESLTGWAQDEATGQPLPAVFDILNEYTRQTVESPATRVLREGVIVGLANHTLLRRRDGRELPIDDSGAPIRDETGRVSGVVLVFRDVTERRSMERALQDSERKLRLIAENMRDTVFAYDMDRVLLYVNPAFETLTGYTVQELYEKNFIDYLYPDDAPRILQLFEQLYAGRAFAGEEFRIVTKNGQLKWCAGTWNPLLDEAGRQIGVQGRELDIHERKRAERALLVQYRVARILAESESVAEIYARALQAICEGLEWKLGSLWHVDPAAQVLRYQSVWQTAALDALDWEDANQDLTFARGADWVGRVWADGRPLWLADIGTEPGFSRRPLALRAGLRAALAFPIRSGSEVIGVLECLTDQLPEPAEDLLALLEALGNQLGNFIERKRAEEALRESRNQLAIILQSVADGITAQDPQGRLVYANAAAARIIGFDSPEALLQTPLPQIMQKFQVFDEAGRPFPLNELPGRHALQGREAASVMLRYQVADTGAEHWSITKARPVFNDRGEVILAVNIFQDVTELKRSEISQRVLAEAGRILSSELDYETRLRNVAQLAVPHLADWCTCDVLEDEEIRRVAVAHVNPDKIALARELRQRYPTDPLARTGVPHVLRTGQPELYPDITDEMLVAGARDAEQLRIARELNLRSLMVVPLIARGRTLGALTFVWAESGRHYGPADLELAEGLARRIALAIDNARLYREAQQLNAELEQRVRERTFELQTANIELETEIEERRQAEEQLQAMNVELEAEVSERQRAEAELAETQRLLTHSRDAERLRLAQELHDGPIQDLYGITYRLVNLRDMLCDDGGLRQLGEAETLLHQVNSTLRLICEDLRPSTLMPFGLEKAIRSDVERLQAAHPELRFELQLMPDEQALPDRVRFALYRIYQHSLMNVIRHAEARQVTIRLQLDAEGALLEVRDDGRGFEVPARWIELARKGHLGLIGAVERAESVGGQLKVASAPGHGTLVQVSVPHFSES